MIKRVGFPLILSLILLLITPEIQAQTTQAMYYLNYPRSVYSLGMGEQSVALRTSEDALNYNPANLVFIERPIISFFHQPFQMAGSLFDMHIPLNSYSAMFNIENIGSFGVEYIDWDFGEVHIIGPDMAEEGISHAYERSFSIGYAREFCDNFSVGILLRYAKSSFGMGAAENLFFSGGLNYSPRILDNKFNIGFSLTNFGGTVDYTRINTEEESSNSSPPPSKLNLGIGFVPIDNNFYSLQAQLAFSKPFDRGPIQNGEISEAESSFKTLFTDWDEFPNDATLHTGIAFNWKPLDLGYGFSFFQEFYIGNYSVGVKSGLNNFYTHGGKIGIEFDGLQFSAGYAGRWHNVHPHNYLQWGFPWETVQFTFGMNEDVLFRTEKQSIENPKPKNIILSFGVGKSFRVGKYEASSFENTSATEGFTDGGVFFIEGAFYINEQNAIVTNIFYNPADYLVKYQGKEYFKTKVEIFSISSSYRYHPLEMFSPLFIQGGLSIIRLNPTSPYFNPKYDYKAALIFSAGGNFDIYEGIVLCPFVNYNLIFSKDGDTAPRLGGFNQFDLGVKVGYKF
jgi:hypothetical protein